jgi:hypothetical protein
VAQVYNSRGLVFEVLRCFNEFAGIKDEGRDDMDAGFDQYPWFDDRYKQETYEQEEPYGQEETANPGGDDTDLASTATAATTDLPGHDGQVSMQIIKMTT